jgi:hypothetical protein
MNSKEDEPNQNTFVPVPNLIFEGVMMNGSGITFFAIKPGIKLPTIAGK